MPSLHDFIADYGYLAVAAVVALECLGVPLPGEVILIAAAIYAGTTHHLDIGLVIAAAAGGAIVGNIIGFVIGRRFGYPLLLRYGGYVGLNDGRIKIGRYLFRQHGAKVIVIARFVAVLRSVGGILAGANHMPWQPFLIANAIGGVAWALVYGLLAYSLGDSVHDLVGPVGIGIGVVVVIAVAAVFGVIARREAELLAQAERAYPGPLRKQRA